MVLYAADHGLQADVVFVIEATAVNGAYINDIKSNYIIPSLEYFSQDNVDETSYISENTNSLYGIVTYQAADCLPNPCTNTYGPLSSPAKVLGIIDRLELIGGKGESHANVAEGLATALCCFEDLYSKRDANITPQKHCVLICNSPPYLLPVLECQPYSGKSAEQLAAVLSEKNINLSVISPRKIPQLYKLFEKGGGDLTASQTKNYAKDPRHLVLLKGFSLKERPLSPTPGASQSQIPNSTLPVSMPSPLAGNDSPIHNSQQNPNILGTNSSPVVQAGVGQNTVYRPPVPTVSGMRMMGSNQMPMGIQSMPAPPGYHTASVGPRASWQMPPPTQQPRPYLQQNQQVNTTTGSSALIAQLQQPPSISGANVNQFGQMSTNSPLNKINMGQPPNVQTSIAQNPGIQTSSMAQVSQANAVATSQAQAAQQVPQQLAGRERHTIWQGILEWIEKPKNMADQKITRHVPCHVSSNSKDGEPEIKADGWPQKLIMQLMPKQLIGTIGGSYLKNSKSVLFHPSPCEALDSLTRVMISNFAGCVHFTSNPSHTTCDIKVLILLYTQDKRAYLGFIPNDQVAFVDRLRKVIQQQKSTQMRPPGNGGPVMNPQAGAQLPVGGSPQQMGANPVTSQNSGIHIAQTNTISIGGGQITQNVPQSGQPMQSMGGMMNQNVGQGGANQQPMQGGMMGAPVRAPFENQLQVERQQNLEKINKLKQTLEAAQQQEQQYKSQLERISHMKTSHLQEALQVAQQTEMQFKMLELNQQQQQRMMRPIMANNPGLRHLLQQPQYRPQIMNMQQMGGNQARGQMGQQMPGGQGGQANTFDEVPNFDFNNIM
ncbi:mediator of RNA polymerase II transcription subunit 25 isoform X2 [Cylas formicarius]|uniref:mediator of RNA polymerase II transcription subunit 25 isoform X2 n=1 Tax=Cylas formicarius TaxID=197179 RepID=UPI002958C58A|nr:mediator of RNA polymerase II transcription subunit 25 isoform X2 [Cylas formicarius]